MDYYVELYRGGDRVRCGEVDEGGVEHGADVAAEVDQTDERDCRQHFGRDVAVRFEGGAGDGVQDVHVHCEDDTHGDDEANCQHETW